MNNSSNLNNNSGSSSSNNNMTPKEETVNMDHYCLGPSCEEEFETPSALQAHFVSSHLPADSLRCTWGECSHASTTQYSLAIHLRTHTGEQPYSCKVPGCEAAYSQAYNLTLHVKAAHKPKSLDFPCPVAGCDKNYTSKNSLLAHTRAKHAARALPCSSCRGSHENIDQLRRCLYKAEGRFRCTCGFKAGRRGELRKHVVYKTKSKKEGHAEV